MDKINIYINSKNRKENENANKLPPSGVSRMVFGSSA